MKLDSSAKSDMQNQYSTKIIKKNKTLLVKSDGKVVCYQKNSNSFVNKRLERH